MNYRMKYQGVKISFYLLALLMWILPAAAQNKEDEVAREPVPAYTGLVNDFGGVLSSQEKAQLEAKLRQYEDSTSTQIVIVIEKSLNGRDQYARSMDFARGWEVGQKGRNNGIVVYLSIEDRKQSIRSAYGTQGRLTDVVSGEIQRDIMRPLLRDGNYFAALDKGTDAIIKVMAGEYGPLAKKKKGMPGWSILLMIILLITFISIINNRGKYRGYNSGGPYWWGGGGWTGGGWTSGGNSDSGGGWGGMGGGGGFDGGGSDGGW